MKLSSISLLLCNFASLLPFTLGTCNFPNGWRENIKWLTHLDPTSGPTKIVPNMVTFGSSAAYTSIGSTPNAPIVNRYCDSYEKVTSNAYIFDYYKRSDISSGPFELCIKESKHGGVIIHAEKNVGGRTAGTSAVCKNEFGDIYEYSVYVPVSITNPGVAFRWNVDLSHNFPQTFARAYYRVTYARDATEDICQQPQHASSSVASIDYNIIGITTCQSHLSGFYTPYSGRIKALAEFSPQVLGEANDNNGRILIMAYLGAEISGFYCARYKTHATSITISLDITSQESLKCQKGARFDWFGRHGTRNYLRFTFTYNSAFSTMLPPNITTTLRPSIDTPAYIQFQLSAQFSQQVTDKTAFGDALKQDVANLAGVSLKRIQIEEIEKDEADKTYVTARIASSNGDGNTVDAGIKLFREATQDSIILYKMSGPTGEEYSVNKKYFYNWRDSDGQCVRLGCQDKLSRCWVITGTYYCKCRYGTTGNKCAPESPESPEASSGLDETTITIIIAVCVVFGVVLILAVVLVICCRHCKKQKGDSEQGNGYDYYNNGSNDERDKEMYSTIGKKPKAYHDKQFVNPKENVPSNIETTGVHL